MKLLTIEYLIELNFIKKTNNFYTKRIAIGILGVHLDKNLISISINAPSGTAYIVREYKNYSKQMFHSFLEGIAEK